MKKVIVVAALFLLSGVAVSAQDSGGGGGGNSGGGGGGDYSDKKNAIAFQAFKMGGIALDYERLIGSRVGLQGTVGLFGAEGAVKFHLKPGIQSHSFYIGLGGQFRNLGYEQLIYPYELDGVFPRLSANFEFRAQRVFTFSGGLGIQRVKYLDTDYYIPYLVSEWVPFVRLNVGIYLPF